MLRFYLAESVGFDWDEENQRVDWWLEPLLWLEQRQRLLAPSKNAVIGKQLRAVGHFTTNDSAINRHLKSSMDPASRISLECSQILSVLDNTTSTSHQHYLVMFSAGRKLGHCRHARLGMPLEGRTTTRSKV